MEKQKYTLTIFTENQTGLLARVVSVFSRRHIGVLSLTTSKSSMPDIHRFTIVVVVTEEMVKILVAQLNKQVDVLRAFYYAPDDIVYQEIALYKIPTEVFNNGNIVEKMIRSHNARILRIEPKYIVVEKTGHPRATEELLNEFKKIGIYEFVRSGRVAIAKPMEELNEYLKTLKK